MTKTRWGKPRNQQGISLIEMAIALALLSVVVVAYARFESRRVLTQRSDIEGEQAAQFAVGLRNFVANVQNTPASMPGAPQLGVNWLKAPTCGGLAGNPADGYVPCSYTGGSFGPLYQTTFTRDAATNAIEARNTFIVPVQGEGVQTQIMQAERVVAASLQQQKIANNGAFYAAWANTPANATGPAPAATVPAPGDVGRVLMVVNNAPSGDIFLRTDGTNRMLANLNVGGFSLENARDGRFSGDVRINQRLQVDQGIVSNGPADLRAGAIAPEVALTSIGKFATEGIYDAQVYTGSSSYTVAKPNCAAAGNNPGIYVAMQGTGSINSSGYQGDALYDARADVFDMGSSWQVVPIVRGTAFTLSLAGQDITLNKAMSSNNPSDMRLLVMTRCR